MFLQKPERIYEDPVQTPVLEVSKPVDVDSFVDQLTHEEVLKLHKKLLDRLYTTAPAVLIEPIPEYKPLEPVQPAESVEEAAQLPVLRQWGKPDGWDRPTKRISFLKVFWYGVLDRDMDLDDYKRYDKFMAWFRPTMIVAALGVVVVLGYKLFTAPDTKSSSNTYLNAAIEWVGDKYRELTTSTTTEDGFKTIPISADTQRMLLDTFNKSSELLEKIDTVSTISYVDSSLILK